MGFCTVLVMPSPKFHKRARTDPVDPSVKVTVSGLIPESGVAVKTAVGGGGNCGQVSGVAPVTWGSAGQFQYALNRDSNQSFFTILAVLAVLSRSQLAIRNMSSYGEPPQTWLLTQFSPTAYTPWVLLPEYQPDVLRSLTLPPE